MIPCLFCLCPTFWVDPYGNRHCGECEPPPAESMARRWVHVWDAAEAEQRVRPAAASAAGLPPDEIDWVQRPDATGRIGWEPRDLPPRDRWHGEPIVCARREKVPPPPGAAANDYGEPNATDAQHDACRDADGQHDPDDHREPDRV